MLSYFLLSVLCLPERETSSFGPKWITGWGNDQKEIRANVLTHARRKPGLAVQAYTHFAKRHSNSCDFCRPVRWQNGLIVGTFTINNYFMQCQRRAAKVVYNEADQTGIRAIWTSFTSRHLNYDASVLNSDEGVVAGLGRLGSLARINGGGDSCGHRYASQEYTNAAQEKLPPSPTRCAVGSIGSFPLSAKIGSAIIFAALATSVWAWGAFRFWSDRIRLSGLVGYSLLGCIAAASSACAWAWASPY